MIKLIRFIFRNIIKLMIMAMLAVNHFSGPASTPETHRAANQVAAQEQPAPARQLVEKRGDRTVVNLDEILLSALR